MSGNKEGGQWEKVARWARMGNNKEGGNRGGEMAEETIVRGAEAGDLEQDVDAGQGGTEQEGGDAVSALAAELEQVKGERDQAMDRLARLQAEFENSRRRESKERQDLRDYAVQNAIEPFLGVMDNFQLAMRSGGSAEQLRAGVELILKQMEEALKGLNVQPVEAVGSQFDPRVHEALASVETPEFPDHQVIEEIRRGYKLRDKLLRPAMVKIAVNPNQKSE